MPKRPSREDIAVPKRAKVDPIIHNNPHSHGQQGSFSQPPPPPIASLPSQALPSPSLTNEALKPKAEPTTLSPLDLWIKCGKLGLELKNAYVISIRCFESALKLDPESTVALNALVDTLVKADVESGKTERILRAIDILNVTMNKYPDIRNDVSLWVKLSNFYLVIDEVEKSHTVLTTALEFSKDDPSLWYILGKCFNKMKLPQDALNALTNALYLLPKELVHEKDINVARSVHLELAFIILNDGDVESAKGELGIVASFPPTTDPEVLQMCSDISERLVLHFFKSGNILNAIWVCQAMERIDNTNIQISLLHGFFLLNPETPFYDVLKARRLFILAIRYDPCYKAASNLLEFFSAHEGDFLPWLLLSECYLYMSYTSVMLDCIHIALTKCTSKLGLPIIRNHCRKLEPMCEGNQEAQVGLYKILNLLSGNGVDERPEALIEFLLHPYKERMALFKSGAPANKMDMFTPPTNPLLAPKSETTIPAVPHSLNNPPPLQYAAGVAQPQFQQAIPPQPNVGVPLGFNYPMHMPPSGAQPLYAPQPLTHHPSGSTGSAKAHTPRSSNTPKSDLEEESRFRQHQEEMRNRQEEEMRLYYQRQSVQPHPGMMLPPIQGYPLGGYPPHMNFPPGSIPAQFAMQQAQAQAQA